MEDKTWHMIGTMSGTSGDGLDIASCEFKKENGKWTYILDAIDSAPYEDDFLEQLRKAHSLSADAYRQLDERYAELNAQRINAFIEFFQLENVDAIVSHGHTVYHEPGVRSIQIGNGQLIANKTGLPVVCNLRTADVEKGGQGAPIVPIGDLHLFKEYRFCLNLGGIANISVKNHDKIEAWDICGCNLLLNYFAQMMDYTCDYDGDLAREGKTDAKFLEAMNQWDYLKKPNPKSLEALHVMDWIFELPEIFDVTVENALSTSVDFIAQAVSSALEYHSSSSRDKLLVTGGGAHNKYLVEQLRKHIPLEIVVPQPELVDFKEAMVMAFFGVLHLRKEANCIPSVTGAREAVSGGELFVPMES